MEPSGGGEWRERMERFQDKMRAFQDRMRDWVNGGRRGEMPKPPVMEGEGRDEMRPARPEREREDRPEHRPHAAADGHSEIIHLPTWCAVMKQGSIACIEKMAILSSRPNPTAAKRNPGRFMAMKVWKRSPNIFAVC